MPRISVIIPVYNSKEYLEQCLESVINQSYGDFEIIIIDDGSSDGSSDICDYYASADQRVRCLHVENAGVSSARNRGLSLAKGEYVTFVDSDDYISYDFFATAMSLMETEDELDFVQFSIDRFHSKKVYFTETSEDIQMKSEDFARTVRFWGSVCASIMRTGIIRDSGVSFDTSLKLGEDQAFLYEYLTHCRQCAKSSEIVYHYRTNYESATNNPSARDLICSLDFFMTYPFNDIFKDKISETLSSLYFQLVASNEISVKDVMKKGEELRFRSLPLPKRRLETIYCYISRLSVYLAVLLTRILSNVIEKR